jgi:hypothetical protein
MTTSNHSIKRSGHEFWDSDVIFAEHNGRPIVRFHGDQLALLISILKGNLSFDEIMSIAQDILADCERLKATAGLPDTCDVKQATTLLTEITEHWEKRTE